VAGGALCKALLVALGAEIRSHVIQISSVRAGAPESPLSLEDFERVDDSPVRCLDPEASRAMVAEIDALRKANESLGGVFEVQAFGLTPGLGSHTSWTERLDGRLAMAICAIQAVKGVTIGPAFEIAARPGSEAHDEIFFSPERGYYRETNRAGGLEGGMTTGQPLILRGAMKPLPTLTQPLRSVDIDTQQPAQALRERTDSCTVPAAAVVAEAMVAFVLACAYREKFGGDHLEDMLGSLRAYQERIGWRRELAAGS
jgi:chorismate synthase